MPSHTNLPAAPAIEFLKLLDLTARRFTYQTFEDRANKTGNPPARVIHAWSELVQDHALGAGAYVTVNETDLAGRKAENIKRIRAVWQEDDDEFAGAFPLEPSLVIETSPKHRHRYWFPADEWPADAQGRKDFEGVMQCMVESYGSDKNAKDISRVLRLPGFLIERTERRMLLGSSPIAACGTHGPKSSPHSRPRSAKKRASRRGHGARAILTTSKSAMRYLPLMPMTALFGATLAWR
jgi:hypothetical protein